MSIKDLTLEELRARLAACNERRTLMAGELERTWQDAAAMEGGPTDEALDHVSMLQERSRAISIVIDMLNERVAAMDREESDRRDAEDPYEDPYEFDYRDDYDQYSDTHDIADEGAEQPIARANDRLASILQHVLQGGTDLTASEHRAISSQHSVRDRLSLTVQIARGDVSISSSEESAQVTQRRVERRAQRWAHAERSVGRLDPSDEEPIDPRTRRRRELVQIDEADPYGFYDDDWSLEDE